MSRLQASSWGKRPIRQADQAGVSAFRVWHSMARIVAGSPWTPARKSSNGVLSPRLDFCESPRSLSAVGFFTEIRPSLASVVRFKLRRPVPGFFRQSS